MKRFHQYTEEVLEERVTKDLYDQMRKMVNTYGIQTVTDALAQVSEREWIEASGDPKKEMMHLEISNLLKDVAKRVGKK